MSATTRLTLRLPEELADELHLLVDSGRVPSASAAVRQALENHLGELQAGNESVRRLNLRLPRRLAEDIESLQAIGELPDWDVFIYEALKAHLAIALKYNAQREQQVHHRVDRKSSRSPPSFLAP